MSLYRMAEKVKLKWSTSGDFMSGLNRRIKYDTLLHWSKWQLIQKISCINVTSKNEEASHSLTLPICRLSLMYTFNKMCITHGNDYLIWNLNNCERVDRDGNYVKFRENCAIELNLAEYMHQSN